MTILVQYTPSRTWSRAGASGAIGNSMHAIGAGTYK
jgi:hypothetical protein